MTQTAILFPGQGAQKVGMGADFAERFPAARAILDQANEILGFDLMENFRRPYFSTSMTEFWRRWHISLSTWLRDYLFVSLGGLRLGPGPARCGAEPLRAAPGDHRGDRHSGP